MARTRGRRVTMVAAGLATAASPVLFGQQVAGAAVTTAHDGLRVFYVTSGDQQADCLIELDVTHNTNNANQPVLGWTTGVSGSQDCQDNITTITATYKDSEGVTRTVTHRARGTTGGSVTGAYTATTVRSDVHFEGCDSVQSPSCDATVTGSPK